MENKGTFLIFRRLTGLLPRKNLFFLGILFIIILSVLEVALSNYLKLILDATIQSHLSLFLHDLYLLLGVIALDVVFVYFRTRVLGTYSESGLFYIRNLLGNKYMHLKMEILLKHHTGDFVSRSTNDMNRIKTFLTSTMPSLISLPLTAVLALVYIFFLSWKLTLISLAVIPVLILGVGFISAPMGKAGKQLQEKLGSANTVAQDFIKGVEVSKVYGLDAVLGKTYQGAIDDTVKIGNKLAKSRSYLNAFSQLFGIVPFFIVFFLGGYYVVQGEMSAGSLLAFINLLNPIVNGITSFPRVFGQAKIDLAAGSRIFETIESQEERTDGSRYSLFDAEPVIEMSNVNFKYRDDGDYTLRNINIQIKKGERVAFVGPSGGGKTSIVRLLLGYYDDYEGEILIGGHELRQWNLGSLREKVALVSQDTFLFPESIAENIRYGKLTAERSVIEKAAAAANADGFIRELEAGYDTQIGELGNKLSGGQKQRIALARAIIKDAEVLLLDEATSALDNESEHLVQEALDQLMNGKTSLVIAHRLSTIKNADRIIVINDGAVAETGTHEELLAQNGIYKVLYEKQLKNTGSEAA